MNRPTNKLILLLITTITLGLMAQSQSYSTLQLVSPLRLSSISSEDADFSYPMVWLLEVQGGSILSGNFVVANNRPVSAEVEFFFPDPTQGLSISESHQAFYLSGNSEQEISFLISGDLQEGIYPLEIFVHWPKVTAHLKTEIEVIILEDLDEAEDAEGSDQIEETAEPSIEENDETESVEEKAEPTAEDPAGKETVEEVEKVDKIEEGEEKEENIDKPEAEEVSDDEGSEDDD